MKKVRYLAMAILILGMTVPVSGQFRKTVYGNKKVTRDERLIDGFTGIKVGSGIDVILRQGNNEKVVVEADDNLHEHIITEVRDNILHVYTNVSIRSAETKRVFVTMNDIRLITTASAGNITGESPVKSDRLRLSASSAGDIRLEVYAREIEVDISSSGDITLSGEADALSAKLSSAGDLNAYDLITRQAEVSVSSAGDADITVTERLRAKASSAGDISYKGDPEYVDAHSSSAGSIRRR